MASSSTIAVVALTSILIACLKKQTAAFKVFTNPKVVYIGLISYSLYLWHWGVLSISRWTIGIHWWSVPFQVALMLGLAVASYRWIETPLRKRNWFGKRWKTLVVGGGVLITLSGGLYALMKQPKGLLYAGNFREATNDDYSEYFYATREKCAMGTYSTTNCYAQSISGRSPKILLIGDSHAGHLIPLMGEIYANLDIGVIVSTSGHYPRLIESTNEGMTIKKSIKKVDELDQLFNKFLGEMNKGDIVVFSSRWEHRLHEDFYNLEHKSRSRKLFSREGKRLSHVEAVNLLEDQIDEIAKKLQFRGIKLVIFAPIPVFRGDENPLPLEACTQEWFRPFISIKCPSNYNEEKENIKIRNKYISNSLAKLSNRHENVYIFNPFDLLCPDKKICTTLVDGKKLFRDDDHLSREGAKYLFDDFKDFLLRII